MNAIPDVHALLTGEEVANRLGLSRERVRQLTGRYDFPPPAGRVGKATVWRAGDVDAYMSGVRQFIAINRVSIGLDQARELAARLGNLRGKLRPAAVPVANEIDALLETGGSVTVTDERAEAVLGALQKWLEDVSLDVFGERLMLLRYQLYGELQDAGRIPR